MLLQTERLSHLFLFPKKLPNQLQTPNLSATAKVTSEPSAASRSNSTTKAGMPSSERTQTRDASGYPSPSSTRCSDLTAAMTAAYAPYNRQLYQLLGRYGVSRQPGDTLCACARWPRQVVEMCRAVECGQYSDQSLPRPALAKHRQHMWGTRVPFLPCVCVCVCVCVF